MRRRPALVLLLLGLILAVGLTLAGLSQRRPPGPPRPAPPFDAAGHHDAPPRLRLPSDLPSDLAPDLAEAIGGGLRPVLPMHKAVRLAAVRFDGKALDITLVAPTPAEGRAGVQIVYRLRMLTRARDVLEIRMDAMDGRFLELRGADLSKVRRKPVFGDDPKTARPGAETKD